MKRRALRRHNVGSGALGWRACEGCQGDVWAPAGVLVWCWKCAAHHALDAAEPRR
jgi:hypothetical protein